MTWQVLEADCVEAMAAMPAASVDAVVCDPPYGLEFMGKDWDRLGATTLEDPAEVGGFQDGNGGNAYSRSRVRFGTDARTMQAWHEAWAREALRVLKPGGHLLAFGGTRTYHRLACAVEDAGFEVRDCVAWLYGSGFPKSLDVSKAIDKAAGAEREVVGQGEPFGRGSMRNRSRVENGYRPTELNPDGGASDITAPATPDAERWQGWGTALKPAHEPIVLARKPLAGTVAANVLAHGTGALNVDGCRIEHASADDLAVSKSKNPGRDDLVTSGIYGAGRGQQSVNDAGRWPANVVMDEQAAAMLDAQTGELAPGNHPAVRQGIGYTAAHGGVNSGTNGERRPTEAGGASRFLYVAKASSAERNAGLDGFEAMPSAKVGAGLQSSVGASAEAHGLAPGTTSSEDRRARNHHPTVKPIELMRWLVRLVTPPGGVVLDPFTGSGTTGIACVLEGLRFVGIEREPEYAAIARARIEWWMAHPEGVEIVKALEAERTRQTVKDSGQLDIFAALDDGAT